MFHLDEANVWACPLVHEHWRVTVASPRRIYLTVLTISLVLIGAAIAEGTYMLIKKSMDVPQRVSPVPPS